MSGRQDYRGSAAALALTVDLSDTTSLSFAVTGDISGWPSGASGRNFAAVIDRGTAKEEKVLCASLSSGTMVLSSRGYDGTVPKTHTSGAVIEHFGLSADKADDVDAHVYDITRDDHTQYVPLNGTRGFTGVGQLTATPSSIGGTSNLSGSALTFARSDHVHAIALGGISDQGMFTAGVVTSAAIGAAAVGNGPILVTGQRLRYIAANAAALPATPTVGDEAFQADIAAHLIYQGPTNGWTAPWNMPWGVVGSVSVGTDSSGITTLADVGVSVTWTAVANRTYEVVVDTTYICTVGGAAMAYTVADGSNTAKRVKNFRNDSSGTESFGFSYLETGIVAGSTTRKLRAQTGSGTLTVKGTTATTQLWVVDVGPNGLPS